MDNPISASGDLKGKVVMVTGANAGMGKEISLALARMGATLVMVCRDRERGEAARAEVAAATGNQGVELLLADLSSQNSIRRLAKDFMTSHKRLDVLVNNAGMSLPTRLETADGIETVFATNHLAPFLLTNLLLPVLTASAPSRVVTVSSGVQAMAKIDFDDLQEVKSYSEIRSYNQSKLANLLFTYELARRLKGTGVTANALEPGFIKTSLKVPFPFSLFSFMRGKPADGAKPTVFLASSPEVVGVTGEFFNNKGVATKSSAISYDEAAAKRLWQVSAELTHLDAPERSQS
ncbi:MAG: retinol dehydrogenase 12 [Chloroflexota bacterium]|nr:retinol dehydrogenase 12 [Chloroflexota bacterium]